MGSVPGEQGLELQLGDFSATLYGGDGVFDGQSAESSVLQHVGANDDAGYIYSQLEGEPVRMLPVDVQVNLTVSEPLDFLFYALDELPIVQGAPCISYIVSE